MDEDRRVGLVQGDVLDVQRIHDARHLWPVARVQDRVEFGAGRGELGSIVQQRGGDEVWGRAGHVLVERGGDANGVH